MISRHYLVILLNVTAGWVDAVGFLALDGRVSAFPSFMSGNSTKVVTDLAAGSVGPAALILAVVWSFMAGAVLGRLVNPPDNSREPAALLMTGSMLVLAAAWLVVGGAGYPALVMAAFAMGMLNRSFGGSGGYVVHTFLSGIVVSFGSALADRMAARTGWQPILCPLANRVSISGGALLGAIFVLKFSVVPALTLAAMPIFAIALLRIADRITPPAASGRDPLSADCE